MSLCYAPNLCKQKLMLFPLDDLGGVGIMRIYTHSMVKCVGTRE